MHPSAYDYVARSRCHLSPDVKLKIVEFGSYNVNGSVRDLFHDCEYLGIDLRAGPGVDVHMDASDWNGAGKYDVVVSTEALEHYKQLRAFCESARRALVMGGLFIATMAAPERGPHGVDGNALAPGEWYQGITEQRLRDALRSGWEILSLEHHPALGDLYVTARKKRRRKS